MISDSWDFPPAHPILRSRERIEFQFHKRQGDVNDQGAHAGIYHGDGGPGAVNEVMRNDYVTAENRVLRAQIKAGCCFSAAEKATLAEIPRCLSE